MSPKDKHKAVKPVIEVLRKVVKQFGHELAIAGMHRYIRISAMEKKARKQIAEIKKQLEKTKI